MEAEGDDIGGVDVDVVEVEGFGVDFGGPGKRDFDII